MRKLSLFSLVLLATVSISCNNKFNSQHSFELTNNVTSVTVSDYYAEQKFGEWETGDLSYQEKLFFNQNNQLEKLIINYEESSEIDVRYKYDDRSLVSIHMSNDKGEEIRRRLVQSFSKDKYTYKDISVDGEVLTVGSIQLDDGKEIRRSYFNYLNGAKYLEHIEYGKDGNPLKIQIYSTDLDEKAFDEKHFEKVENLEIDDKILVLQYEYLEFDKYGNWITRFEFHDDDSNPTHKSERTLEYSD